MSLLTTLHDHVLVNSKGYEIQVRATHSVVVFFVWQVIEAGANAIVSGSAVFGAKDYAEGMNLSFLLVLFSL